MTIYSILRIPLALGVWGSGSRRRRCQVSVDGAHRWRSFALTSNRKVHVVVVTSDVTASPLPKHVLAP